MAKKSTTDIMGHRSEALAFVTLTRVPTIKPVRFDIGQVDFLAVIQELTQFRFFGVIVKGTMDVKSARDANVHGRRLNVDQRLTGLIYPFPTIVLLFSMDQEIGYYAWHMEPTVNEEDSPLLVKHESLNFHLCDQKALESIVASVEEW